MTKESLFSDKNMYWFYIFIACLFLFSGKYMYSAFIMCIAFIYKPFDAVASRKSETFLQKNQPYIHIVSTVLIFMYGMGFVNIIYKIFKESLMSF